MLVDRYARFHSHGSVREIFDWEEMCNVELPIPPIEEQKAIVNAYETIERRIALKRKINDNLEAQISTLYRSWFENFNLTNGICPESWSRQTFSTIADISSGKRPPVKSENYSKEIPVPIIGAASIMGFTTEANHKEKILVIGRVGTHGVVQRCNIPCWTSDNTLVITSRYYEFTYQILQRIDYSSMNRGSTQPLITQGDMENILVMIPDEGTLAEFERLAGLLMAQWDMNNNETDKLVSLKDTLLSNLVSDKTDTSTVEN